MSGDFDVHAAFIQESNAGSILAGAARRPFFASQLKGRYHPV